MSYEIKLHKDAVKSLKKINKHTRIRILDQLALISENPFNPQLPIRKMQGVENVYRLRVGSYRAIFSIVQKELVIFVIKIGPRGGIYK